MTAVPDWDLPAAGSKKSIEVPDWDLPSAKKEPTSGGKAFGKELAEQAVPSAGGWAGAAAGAKLGAKVPGILKLAAIPLGAIGGGIAGYSYGWKGQEKALESVPEETKAKVGFSKEQRARERTEHPLSTGSAEVITAVPSLLGIGRSVVPAAKAIGNFFKSPEGIAKVTDFRDLGEKGFKLLQDKAASLFKARSEEAKDLYDTAYEAARTAQAKGKPFATSKEGQALIDALEKEKTVITGGKEFEKGADKIAGIDRLINAIKGTTTGGFKRVAKDLPKGKVYADVGTPLKTTQKDIDAIVEELRFLRDVDAKGQPYQAYAALDANYKRDLVKKLESSLYSWNKEYETADRSYKAASQKLAPFKTQLMSNALKGEKFNSKDLVKAPEEFGHTFFKDTNSVQNLKQVVNDDAEVAQLGKEYVANHLSNMTPQQIKSWAFDPMNTGWLKEAGIIEPVQQYAQQATSAADKQSILKRLVKYASVGAAGGAAGSVLASKASQLFGGP